MRKDCSSERLFRRSRTRLWPSRPSDGHLVRFCVILILDRAILRRVILPPRDILHFRLLRSLFHVKQAQFTVPARAGLSKEGFPMKILDGFGKQCPMPLVMAKKELDAGATELAIQVDNETAVKNLTRLGKKKNMATSVDKIEGLSPSVRATVPRPRLLPLSPRLGARARPRAVAGTPCSSARISWAMVTLSLAITS